MDRRLIRRIALSLALVLGSVILIVNSNNPAPAYYGNLSARKLSGFKVGNGPATTPRPANTKLLVHADGADTSTTFTDNGPTGHTITANGNAQVDTAQSVFGGASLLLDGTGDYLSAADNADFEFGTNAFTVEAWVRFASLSGTNVIASKWTATGNQRAWQFYYDHGTTRLGIGMSADGNSTLFIEETWAPVIDTWYHVAVVRTGGNIYHFVDGVKLGTEDANSTNIFSGTAGINVGAVSAGTGSFFNGWCDELLIVNGTGLYTSNFTPPTLPYAN